MIVIGNKEKKDWISKAKGFGILGIVAVHTVQKFVVPSHLSSVASAGMYCVQLFFVLSAYLTFVSLEKTKHPMSLVCYLKYLGHKLLRLVPVLYTAVLWHVIMYAIQIGGVPKFNDTIWKDVLFAITFLNGFSYHHINPWVNWYIGGLVIFLAVAPLLFRWITTLKKAVVFFVGSMFFAWLSSIVVFKLGFEYDCFFYYWFPNQLPVLAIGIAFYFFQRGEIDASKKKSVGVFLFVVSACLLLSLFFFTTPLQVHVRYGLFLFVFVYVLFNNSGKWFDWLMVLGDYSYGIYLYHFCLLTVFDCFVNWFDINRTSVPVFICSYVLLVALSLVISKLANVLVEKPFFNFMKRKFDI